MEEDEQPEEWYVVPSIIPIEIYWFQKLQANRGAGRFLCSNLAYKVPWSPVCPYFIWIFSWLVISPEHQYKLHSMSGDRFTYDISLCAIYYDNYSN